MSNWNYKLDISDIFHNDDFDLSETSRTISDRIKRNKWYKDMEERYQEEMGEILEELVDAGEAADNTWFNQVWSAIYDIADDDRTWIKTR